MSSLYVIRQPDGKLQYHTLCNHPQGAIALARYPGMIAKVKTWLVLREEGYRVFGCEITMNTKEEDI